jgi:hypothetical protein
MARLKVIIAVTVVLLLLPLFAQAQPRPWDEPILCPNCKSGRVIYILYGEPILDDDLKRAIETRKVELAGCIVTQDSHRWECRNCGHKWGQVQLNIGLNRGGHE